MNGPNSAFFRMVKQEFTTPAAFPKTKISDVRTLERIWKNLVENKEGGFFGKSIAEQNRIFVSFVLEANKQQINNSSAVRFIREKQYLNQIKKPWKMSGGQAPRFICVTNSPRDPLQKVVNHRGKTLCEETKRLDGGTFGLSVRIDKLSDINHVSDSQPISFILEHNAQGGHKIPVYAFFSTQFSEGNGVSFDEAALLSIERRDKARLEAIDSGHLVTNKILKIAPKNGPNAPVHLIAVVHNITKRALHVVEKSEKKGITKTVFYDWCMKEKLITKAPYEGTAKTDFDAWLKENGITGHQTVLDHLYNLELHRNDAYYEDAVKIASEFVSVKCVDSRMFLDFGVNNWKLIGAYPNEWEFLQIIKDPAVKEIEFVIHTNCGYLKNAVKLHKMFKEISEKTDGKSITRKRIADAVSDIIAGREFGMKLQAFINEMDGLSKDNLDSFKEFFGSPDNDPRKIFIHMHERGIFAMNDSEYALPFMPAANEVEKELAGKEAELQKGTEFFMVTEAIARQLQTTILTWLIKHEDAIMEARGPEREDIPLPRVVVSGLVTALKWHPPTDVSIDSLARQDAVLRNAYIPPETIREEL